MNPFEFSRALSSNIFGAQRQNADKAAISDILNQFQKSSMGQGQLQDGSLGGQDQAAAYASAMNRILTEVSQDRQGGVFQALQAQQAQTQQQQQQNRDSVIKSLVSKAYRGEPISDSEFNMLPPQVQKDITKEKPSPGGVTAQPIPQEIQLSMQEVVSNNPNSTSDQLAIEFDKAGIPRIHSNLFIENRRRQEESQQQRSSRLEETIRKETLPIKQQIVEKAQSARETIRNKESLSALIDTGNIDDPTFAIFATSLPLNLGERLLSDETVQYRGALVDEFKDLRNIFKGQTRVAELDILQKKLPDIYLTDSQKKAILKSRINALNADLIREEAAAEAELKYPDLGILQFQKKVEEIAKPKLKSLLNDMIADTKHVFDQAERRKSRPLDPNDPDDKEILIQFIKESNGDKNAARKKAKKLGYKF
jgi:Skp family chaperone for outer membrane proteins